DLSAAGFDAEVTAALAEQARAAGLTQEQAAAQAKGLAQFVSAIETRRAESAMKAAEAALRADPEFGGANYDKTLADAKSAAVSLFGEQFLQRTPLGNDPDFIKGLVKLHRAGLVKGDFVAGGNARDGGEKTTAAIFYGDSMK